MPVSNLETAFVREALAAGCRIDGRALTERRPVTLELDPQTPGQVFVSLGHTSVVARVSANIARPYGDRPTEGLVNYFVELSSLAVPLEAASGEVYDEEEVRLQRLLDRILKNGRFVDTESLCLLPGEQVWSIRIDLRVLNHDGNVIEALVTAAVAALVSFCLPACTVTDGIVKLYSSFERHPVPLTLHNQPIAVAFGIFDTESEGSDHATKQTSNMVVIADPSWIEEQMGCGNLVMAVNRHGELVTVVKSGGEALDVTIINEECLRLAHARAVDLLDLIKNKLRPK